MDVLALSKVIDPLADPAAFEQVTPPTR